jgi:mRNA-degrading endonuclease RelE of RelBE toxin-antitoxin system
MQILESARFKKQRKQLDSQTLRKLSKVILKILFDPRVGKPLRYRRNERVIRIKPYRLIYSYNSSFIYLLTLEHRGVVYD